MSIKSTILSVIAVLLIIGNVFATTPFSSLDEFIKWERDLKINAKFNSNYKVPDYIRLAFMNSGPESAGSRYNFFIDNPQYVEDYANIHNGQLSKFPTDGSTLTRSKLDNMPPEIAAYYREHNDELLAAEGFGFDPVLARKVYTGEIALPYGVNKTEWLRSHAWTPNGIVEKNNVVAYAQTDYNGYNLRKIDPATGKPIEPSGGDQAKGNIELYNKYQKDMETIAGKIQLIHDSIGVSLQTSPNGAATVDCSGR